MGKAERADSKLVALAYGGGHDWPKVVPGSLVMGATCGHRVWVSPQGLAYFRIMESVCTNCYRPEPGQEKIAVRGSVENVRRTYGNRMADEMLEAMRRDGVKEE